MTKSTLSLLAALALAALLLGGCSKKMSDDDFVAVASKIYEDVRAGWDSQPDEDWNIYFERRIGEACSANGYDIKHWDVKVREVMDEPGKWRDKFEPTVLDQVLQWQHDRLAAKGKV